MAPRSRSPSRSRSPTDRYSSSRYDRGERSRRSPPPRERSPRRTSYRETRDYRDDYRGSRGGGGGGGGDRGDYRGGDRYDDRRPPRRRFQDGRENPRPSSCLGIFGMSMNTTEQDLRQIFEKYGPVESVKIIMDHHTRRSRGFGFISFEHRADATKARERVADQIIDGMRVRVDYAIQRRRSPPPRERSPVGRDRRYSSDRRYSISPTR